MVLGSLKVPNGQLRIMSGRTKPQRFPVVPPSNDDANDLSHDAAGLLSVRRGGGAPLCGKRGLGQRGAAQRGLGQLGLRHAPPATGEAQGGLQPRPASAKLAAVFWLPAHTGLALLIGSFEFMLTPAANAKLDKEWLVIGQIVEPEGMQVLARLNSLPTNNYDQTPIVLVKVERAVPLPSGGAGKA